MSNSKYSENLFVWRKYFGQTLFTLMNENSSDVLFHFTILSPNEIREIPVSNAQNVIVLNQSATGPPITVIDHIQPSAIVNRQKHSKELKETFINEPHTGKLPKHDPISQHINLSNPRLLSSESHDLVFISKYDNERPVTKSSIDNYHGENKEKLKSIPQSNSLKDISSRNTGTINNDFQRNDCQIKKSKLSFNFNFKRKTTVEVQQKEPLSISKIERNIRKYPVQNENCHLVNCNLHKSPIEPSQIGFIDSVKHNETGEELVNKLEAAFHYKYQSIYQPYLQYMARKVYTSSFISHWIHPESLYTEAVAGCGLPEEEFEKMTTLVKSNGKLVVPERPKRSEASLHAIREIASTQQLSSLSYENVRNSIY